MRHLIIFALVVFAGLCQAQTEVRTSSFAFNVGVQPTFSVLFRNADARTVEAWFKDHLKDISAEVSSKKDLVAIGTRLPEVSTDTIRVYVKADQPKKSIDVTLHLAFKVGSAFVGPDSEARQVEGCKAWVYQEAVMLKKMLAQRELDAGTKLQARLEDDLAMLVRENERAQKSIEKTQQNITDDEKAKADTEGELGNMLTKLDSKKQDVANAPSEENTKQLQALVKEQEKLQRKSEKLIKDITNGGRKIEDLRFEIKKNLADQDAKAKAIEAQKLVVESLREKLANVN
jgi:hypothetical protein